MFLFYEMLNSIKSGIYYLIKLNLKKCVIKFIKWKQLINFAAEVYSSTNKSKHLVLRLYFHVYSEIESLIEVNVLYRTRLVRFRSTLSSKVCGKDCTSSVTGACWLSIMLVAGGRCEAKLASSEWSGEQRQRGWGKRGWAEARARRAPCIAYSYQ